MAHDHGNHGRGSSDRWLVIAVAINLLLTLVEIVGGIAAGSLALVADALHNFSDAAALGIALVARRIARREADTRRTFGYRRAEILAALINLTVLVVVALYLFYEAIGRIFDPRPIHGGLMLGVALVALVVDGGTVLLLARSARHSLNIRAALLHNLGDALSSVGVMIAAVGVIIWDAAFLDPLITFAIAGYVLWHTLAMMRRAIHILMESAPAGLDLERLVGDLCHLDGILDIHHVHVWQLDEFRSAMEAHVVIDRADVDRMSQIKKAIKDRLAENHEIAHSTLEFEFPDDEHCLDQNNEIVPRHL